MNPIPPRTDATELSCSSIERLVLTGFMGSGKTTIGDLLASQLGWRFVDLDTEIERRDGRTVPEIFAQSGEAAFRGLETEALRASLVGSHLVLALGGGAVETPANCQLLASTPQTLTILLTAPFDTLYERCIRQRLNPTSTHRPLLGDAESAAQRLARRDGLYRSVAGLVVDTLGQSPAQTVQSMLQSLRRSL